MRLSRFVHCARRLAVVSRPPAAKNDVIASLCDAHSNRVRFCRTTGEAESYKKRTSGAESDGLQKRKALTTDAAKCLKMSDIFARREQGQSTEHGERQLSKLANKSVTKRLHSEHVSLWRNKIRAITSKTDHASVFQPVKSSIANESLYTMQPIANQGSNDLTIRHL